MSIKQITQNELIQLNRKLYNDTFPKKYEPEEDRLEDYMDPENPYDDFGNPQWLINPNTSLIYTREEVVDVLFEKDRFYLTDIARRHCFNNPKDFQNFDTQTQETNFILGMMHMLHSFNQNGYWKPNGDFNLSQGGINYNKSMPQRNRQAFIDDYGEEAYNAFEATGFRANKFVVSEAETVQTQLQGADYLNSESTGITTDLVNGPAEAGATIQTEEIIISGVPTTIKLALEDLESTKEELSDANTHRNRTTDLETKIEYIDNSDFNFVILDKRNRYEGIFVPGLSYNDQDLYPFGEFKRFGEVQSSFNANINERVEVIEALTRSPISNSVVINVPDSITTPTQRIYTIPLIDVSAPESPTPFLIDSVLDYFFQINALPPILKLNGKKYNIWKQDKKGKKEKVISNKDFLKLKKLPGYDNAIILQGEQVVIKANQLAILSIIDDNIDVAANPWAVFINNSDPENPILEMRSNITAGTEIYDGGSIDIIVSPAIFTAITLGDLIGLRNEVPSTATPIEASQAIIDITTDDYNFYNSDRLIRKKDLETRLLEETTFSSGEQVKNVDLGNVGGGGNVGIDILKQGTVSGTEIAINTDLKLYKEIKVSIKVGSFELPDTSLINLSNNFSSIIPKDLSGNIIPTVIEANGDWRFRQFYLNILYDWSGNNLLRYIDNNNLEIVIGFSLGTTNLVLDIIGLQADAFPSGTKYVVKGIKY